jgi:hypothetical protein
MQTFIERTGRKPSGGTQAIDTIFVSAFVGRGLVGASVVAGVSRSLLHGLGGFVDRRLFRHGERQSSIKTCR